jgi:hypothetical protein
LIAFASGSSSRYFASDCNELGRLKSYLARKYEVTEIQCVKHEPPYSFLDLQRRVNRDYMVVNEAVWSFMVDRFGAGKRGWCN